MKTNLLFICLLAGLIYAQKPAYNPETSKGKLFEYAEFVEVNNDDYIIRDILNSTILEYDNLKNENHDFGFTSSTYWVRFKLQNSSSNPKKYYLETARPITDIVELYKINNLNKVKKSGDQIPFSQRDVSHR